VLIDCGVTMDIKQRTVDGVVIVDLDGRLDSLSVPAMSQIFDELSSKAPAKILAQMQNVSFIDSTALAVLVKTMKRCRQHQGDLVISNLARPVKVIFELTRLDKAFNLYDTEEQALKAFK
jgi:anti-sigma B factor antagonist